MYRRNGDAKRLKLPRFAKKERRKPSANRTPLALCPADTGASSTPGPIASPKRTHARENDGHSHVARRRRTSRRALWRPARPAAALVARLSSADTARLAVCDPGPGVLAPLSWGSALAISPLPFPARRTSSAHRGCKPAREREARPPTTQSVRRKASPPLPPLSRTGRARRWVGAELLAAVRRARREEVAARRLWRQVSAEASDEAAVRVVRGEQPPTLRLWASISSVHPGRGRRLRGFVTARRHCGSRPTPPSRTPREGTRVAR